MSDICFMGKPLKECSKTELIMAIEAADAAYNQVRKSLAEVLKLMECIGGKK